MTVHQMSYTEIRASPALLESYAAECSIPEIGPINPQWEMYAAMEAAGTMRCFGLYADGDLVGFGTLLVSVLPHYGILAGVTESIYVGREYRGTVGAALLLLAMEKHAKQADCVAFFKSAPAGGPLEATLERRESRTSSIFCKALAAL